MSLREEIFTRCTTHAGLSGLIESRCYLNSLPEDVTYPCVVYYDVSSTDNEYRDHDAKNIGVERTVTRVQFNCYDDTSDGARAVSDQVVSAWDGYADDCTLGRCFIANRLSDRWQTQIDQYREIVDVQIEHEKE